MLSSAGVCSGALAFSDLYKRDFLADYKYVSYSSLFADDLATIILYQKQGKVKERTEIYLQSLI